MISYIGDIGRGGIVYQLRLFHLNPVIVIVGMRAGSEGGREREGDGEGGRWGGREREREGGKEMDII